MASHPFVVPLLHSLCLCPSPVFTPFSTPRTCTLSLLIFLLFTLPFLPPSLTPNLPLFIPPNIQCLLPFSMLLSPDFVPPHLLHLLSALYTLTVFLSASLTSDSARAVSGDLRPPTSSRRDHLCRFLLAFVHMCWGRIQRGGARYACLSSPAACGSCGTKCSKLGAGLHVATSASRTQRPSNVHAPHGKLFAGPPQCPRKVSSAGEKWERGRGGVLGVLHTVVRL